MTVTVKTVPDEARLDDATVQRVLKAYIEQQTGRKPDGEVFFDESRNYILGQSERPHYTAHCALKPKETK